MLQDAKWYVVHTYSGYENKVKANIEKIIENRNMQEQILKVVVPIQDAIEEKNGKKKVVPRKVFPGYVLIKMQMNDDTWYVVRNTRGVTGFVGPGSKPVPLTEQEIKVMGIDISTVTISANVGQIIKVVSGPFEGAIGTVTEVNNHKHTITVKLSIFGRETPVELNYDQIEKM